MIEKAVDILQMAIDVEWEKVTAQIKSVAQKGKTNLAMATVKGIGCEILRSEMFIEQLLEAGYDVDFRTVSNGREIVKISWKDALPGRKGETKRIDW